MLDQFINNKINYNVHMHGLHTSAYAWVTH